MVTHGPRTSVQVDPNAARAQLAGAIGGSRPHLIGIGGSGLSALARLLADAGLGVRGCDSTPQPTTEQLREAGVAVSFEEGPTGLAPDADVVIASAAVKPDHPQVLEAQRRGLSILQYAEALGRVMSVRTGICVAGTHGKSTTTAMLGCVLTDCGLDPSVIVGATCAQLGAGALASPGGTPTGFRLGSAEIPSDAGALAGSLAGRPGLLVAESCEYNRSFHNLRPLIAAINAVEADHLDVYASLDEIIEAFRDFARLIPSRADGGKLIIAHDGAHRIRVTAGLECAVETIGFAPEADHVVSFEPKTRRVSLTHRGRVLGTWVNRMPGAHNAMNAAMAFTLACAAGAQASRAAESLAAFRGLDRRLQLMGERDHVRVYDDYGHHPTEVEATLKAIRQFDDPGRHGGRLIVVFQPHQHSRTRHLLEEFATSFGPADVVIVPHIYFVRDSQIEKAKVSAADLVDRLRRKGVRAMHLYPFEAIAEQLENLVRPGDVMVVMGAGPVYEVGQMFLSGGGGGGRA